MPSADAIVGERQYDESTATGTPPPQHRRIWQKTGATSGYWKDVDTGQALSGEGGGGSPGTAGVGGSGGFNWKGITGDPEVDGWIAAATAAAALDPVTGQAISSGLSEALQYREHYRYHQDMLAQRAEMEKFREEYSTAQLSEREKQLMQTAKISQDRLDFMEKEALVRDEKTGLDISIDQLRGEQLAEAMGRNSLSSRASRRQYADWQSWARLYAGK